MDWISCAERLPDEGTYVLGWNGSFHLVKIEKGITEEQREKMKAGQIEDSEESGWCKAHGWFTIKRSEIIKSCDVWGNNLVPYSWRECNGNEIFGQKILYWMPLPPPPIPDYEKKRKEADEAIKRMDEVEIEKLAARFLLGLVGINLDQIVSGEENHE